MDQDAIIRYITDTFTSVDVAQPTEGPGVGDTFFSYNSPHNKNQFPFATIVTKDYAGFDEASQLNRPDVFRLNVGVGKDTFRSLFGAPAAADGRTSGAGAGQGTYDFTALDRLMPHPTYGTQSWVCVLNPSVVTFDAIKPLLAEAYSITSQRYAGRDANPD